tara:strand:- start:421 stop:813 length:393 start_codon:yes stop_codon:yes gene_type:complete
MPTFYKVELSSVVAEIIPNCSFSIGNDYESLIIHTPGIVKPTEQQFNEKLTELREALPLKVLREQRTELLKTYDWRTLRHASGGIALSQDWINYLQELRDLPQTQTPKIENGKLVNVLWPTEPNPPLVVD